MTRRAAAAAAAFLLSPAAPPPHALTDAELKAIAVKPFSRMLSMGRREVLGTLRGVPVLADHPCSDLCPAYTRRIIHFDLEPGPACVAAGGVVRKRIVPVSIASTQRAFCVPATIADLPEPFGEL